MTITRKFIRYTDAEEIPDAIVDLFHEVLDQKYPFWWAELTTPAEGYWQDRGPINWRIWLEKRYYDRHEKPDFKVQLGYWRDHPKFKGAWYYFFEVDEIAEDLKQELQEVETA